MEFPLDVTLTVGEGFTVTEKVVELEQFPLEATTV
jgi:hypothetical protein